VSPANIAEEAARRTDFLDPGGPGLTELRAEPFGLRHAAKVLWHRRDAFFAKLIPADGARRMP
jgi:hypothetical protein